MHNTFSEAQDIIQQRVYDYLEEISSVEKISSFGKNSLEYKLATMYMQIKVSKENDVATKKVKSYLEQIENVTSFVELQELYNTEDFSIFNRLINVDVDNLGGRGTYNVCMSPIDLYNIRSALTKEQSTLIRTNIKNELELLGYSSEEATRISTEAILLNDSICNYYGNSEKKYSFININSLETRVKNISLNGMLESLGYVSSNNIVFVEENYLSLLRQLYAEENLEMIKSYHIVSVLHTLIHTMPKNIYTIYDSTDEMILNSTYKADDMRYAMNMINIMSDGIGKVYSDKYISEKVKADLRTIAEDIRQTFIKRIDSLDWMEDSTKKAAKKKIENIYVYAGEAGRYNDYMDAEIEYIPTGENIVDNYLKILISNKQYRKSNMDKNVERDKMNFSIMDANLYYVPNANVVIICAGMINDNVINEDMSYEEMLGKIGVVIAHEFGHAIDSNGCDFDENGMLKSWWKSADYNKFIQKTNMVKNYYNGMEIVNGAKINGEMIKAEAMADLTAMTCCLELLKEKENIDYDKFFTAYASLYKQIANIEYEEYLALVDNHLPVKHRVNYILNQFEEFYDTYKIEEGDKLYLNTEDRINIF